MRSQICSVVLALALAGGLAPLASAQESHEDLLQDAMLLTPRTLRALVDEADAGDAVAQYQVALAYYYGYGVRKMPSEATPWSRMAAEQGFAPAQHLLATMYRDGQGLERDMGEAARWFRAAADQGFADAEYEYGLMLFDGLGVPQDQAEAFKWFSSGADHGSVAAQTYVGIMYVNGLGVPADLAQGYQHLLEAAQGGGPMAQANLGALYANGVGVAQDPNEALIWFMVARQGGFDGVDPLIADLSAQISEDDVSAARGAATTRRDEILMVLSGGSGGAAPDDEEALAALSEIGQWLTSTLPTAGSFTFTIGLDPRGGRRGSSGGGGFPGRIEITDVALEGCRLSYATVGSYSRRSEPQRWEVEVDLAAVDLDELRVQGMRLPRTVVVGRAALTIRGSSSEVYLRAAGYPTRSFTVVRPDGASEPALEASIPIGDRGEAETVADRLREAATICGSQ